MCWVYILKNDTVNKYYVGCTIDPNERLVQHQAKRRRKWSGRQEGSWQLVYKKKLSNKTEALRFEKEIKRKKSRRYIEALIENKITYGVVD